MGRAYWSIGAAHFGHRGRAFWGNGAAHVATARTAMGRASGRAMGSVGWWDFLLNFSGALKKIIKFAAYSFHPLLTTSVSQL
jgi:hypothetical protein